METVWGEVRRQGQGQRLHQRSVPSYQARRAFPPRCQCTSLQLCTVCVVTCGEPSLSPNCVCAGRWSRPTMLFLSVPQWRVTLNLLLISFDRLICRRISPVCVVSVTTRGGVWRWTQPSWYLPLVRLLTSRVCLLPRSIVPVSVSAHVPRVQLLGPAVPQSKTYSPFLFLFSPQLLCDYSLFLVFSL